MTTSNRKTTDNKTVSQRLFDQPQRTVVSSSKRSVITDPEVSINDRLEELSSLVAMMKDTKTKIETIKDSFLDDLQAALDDSEDRPMITHNMDKNMRVFLQLRNTYRYSDKLVEKRKRIKNLQADLKAAEDKAVRENKAELIKTDYSVVFKG
jgi:hypothetical protein|tara:strand:- start:241 stop:696 length:456 start_codon:yes stop_codon:yes gene_type:complete